MWIHIAPKHQEDLQNPPKAKAAGLQKKNYIRLSEAKQSQQISLNCMQRRLSGYSLC